MTEFSYLNIRPFLHNTSPLTFSCLKVSGVKISPYSNIFCRGKCANVKYVPYYTITHFIISGDNHLFELKQYKNTRIITPSDYLKEY
jgi:predicted nucleic acid-binding protein